MSFNILWNNPVFVYNKLFIQQTPNMNHANRQILFTENIDSNWKYRNYAQQNANDLLKINYNRTAYANNIHPIPLAIEKNSDIKQNYMERRELISRIVCPEIPIYQEED